MKVIKIHLLVLLIIYGCEGKKESTLSTSQDVGLTAEGEKVSSALSPSITNKKELVQKKKVTPVFFMIENKEVLQTITLDFIAKDSLKFDLLSKNKSRNEESRLAGIAILKGGSEFDEDENGLGYLADEYIYENGCWLAIRWASEDKDKVKIHEANCEGVREESCPFESIGIMRPTDN